LFVFRGVADVDMRAWHRFNIVIRFRFCPQV
jgi:hypothetical protein